MRSAIPIIKSAFRRLTSASGSRMSAKTLPLLFVLTGLFIFALYRGSVQCFSVSEPRIDLLNLVKRRLNSLARFLLKGMEHINDAAKFDGVDRPEGVSVEIRYNLENTSAFEPFQGFCIGMLAALLGRSQSEADTSLNIVG